MSEGKGMGLWAHCWGSLLESRVGSGDLCSQKGFESHLSKRSGVQARRLLRQRA